MDKNKSIDGLNSRSHKTTRTSRAKNNTSSSTHKTKSTTKPAAPRTTKSSLATKSSRSKSSAPRSPRATKSSKAPSKPVKIHLSSQPSEPDLITDQTPVDISFTDTNPTATDTNPTTDAFSDFLQPVQAFNFNEESGKLEAASDPIHHSTSSTKMSKHSPKPKKSMSKKKKIILSLVFVFFLLIIAGSIVFIVWGNDIIAKITGGQGTIFDLVFTEESYEPLKADSNGRTNILAFGTSGYDMSGTEGDTIHDGAQLTDSIMVISLNQKTGDIAMLSLPRDLKASTTCTATGKINEVYWCNNTDGDNEAAGAKALMTEVGKILGLDFQYYAHLNWESLRQIVDTLGGVTIRLDEPIQDYYYTGAVYEANVDYTITGHEAVALARARHGTTSGDFSRGASQQKIIIGIKNKIFSKGLSLADLLSLAGTLGDNLRTNLSATELKTFAHLASTFDFNNMRQISLLDPVAYMTTGIINNISYVLPVGGAGYYTNIQKYISEALSNDPKIYESPSILVLNGTDTTGLAATEQSSLTQDGYLDVDIADAPAGDYSHQYILYALTDKKPATKKLLETKYHTTSLPASDLPANISTDYDFILVLGEQKTEN